MFKLSHRIPAELRFAACVVMASLVVLAIFPVAAALMFSRLPASIQALATLAMVAVAIGVVLLTIQQLPALKGHKDHAPHPLGIYFALGVGPLLCASINLTMAFGGMADPGMYDWAVAFGIGLILLGSLIEGCVVLATMLNYRRAPHLSLATE